MFFSSFEANLLLSYHFFPHEFDSMMQTVKKVFASGSMAASLLQQEVEGLQTTVDYKNRELEGAYDIIATQEDKINSMASQLKDITEKLKKNAQENNNPRNGFLKTVSLTSSMQRVC